MKIQVLEFGQSLSESPKHSIASGKAKRLVDDLGWAKRISKHVIQVTIAKSWSAIKAWLAASKEQLEQIERRAEAMAELAAKHRANSENPNGAEYGFTSWPCKDQRTIFAL